MKTFIKILTVITVSVWLFCSAVFFIAQLKEAFLFPMWMDEVFGLDHSIRSHSYLHLIVHGAQGQGSPSPLDYLLLKFWDQIKESIHLFNLPLHVYLRLIANFTTSFFPLLILVFLLKEIRKQHDSWIQCSQLFLTLSIPICYYFAFQVYKYAHEARPYAIWNSFYFLSLGFFLTRKNLKWSASVPLSLLALSATASIFQIGSILIAFCIMQFIEKKPVKDLLRETSLVFAVPLLISLYYSSGTGTWTYDFGSWADFFKLWSHQWGTILLLTGLGGICFLKRETRMISIAPLSFALLYLMGPLIFWITKWKGFFYADRQYLYYELGRSLVLLTIVALIPALIIWISNRKKRLAVLICLCLATTVFAWRPKLIQRFQNTFYAASDVIRFGVGHSESS